MQALEVFCTCWFTFEVVTRLLLAPNRKKFFHHPLNIIDMVSVVPIYITLVFDMAVGSESELGDIGRLIQVEWNTKLLPVRVHMIPCRCNDITAV